MRHRLQGPVFALFSLVGVYLLAWLTDLGGTDYDATSIVMVPLFAGVLSAAVLFILVLPQAFFARFVVRRFCNHQAVPFGLFVGISSLLVAPVARWFSAGSPLSTLAWGVAYLSTGCSVLWCISFRHADTA